MQGQGVTQCGSQARLPPTAGLSASVSGSEPAAVHTSWPATGKAAPGQEARPHTFCGHSQAQLHGCLHGIPQLPSLAKSKSSRGSAATQAQSSSPDPVRPLGGGVEGGAGQACIDHSHWAASLLQARPAHPRPSSLQDKLTSKTGLSFSLLQHQVAPP